MPRDPDEARYDGPVLDDLREIRSLSKAFARYFAHGAPRLLALQLGLALAARSMAGSPTLVELWILVGIVIYWPLQEWFLHAYLLHMRPRTLAGRRIDPLAARVHRAHHRAPWSAQATFLPVKVLLLLIPLNFAFWWLAMPTRAASLTGIVGFTLAAMIYEWIHYLTHTGYRPRGRWYRRVWKNHRLHHFKSERNWYAFTAPWVDVAMGTSPDPSEVPTSPTVRSLGIDG